MANSKTIRVRMENIFTAQGEVTIPLYDEDVLAISPRGKSFQSGGDCHIWFNSDGIASLYAVSETLVLPLFHGISLDQVYNFGPAVTHIKIKTQAPDGLFAWRCLFHGIRYREANSGIPKTLPIPLDDNSFQRRVLNAVHAALDQRGIASGHASGQNYGVQDDDADHDPEFGEGYAYDETVEQEIETAAARAVAQRLKPRMQRGQPSDAPRERLADDGDQPNPTPAGDRRRPNPSQPVNPGARRDAAPGTND